METLKHAAGYAMIGTAIWLLSGVQSVFPTLILLLLLTVAVRFPKVWWIAILAIAPFNMHSDAAKWVEYYPGVEKTGVVLVDFSAPLCLTCDLNKATLERMDLAGVVLVDADVANNPAAARLLTSLGYDSVPVLAIYAPGSAPIVLPDLITAADVAAALETLGE
jgi:thiol:disulfide interchange protein